MNSPRLILASASPARAALLRAAGVEPIIEPANVDEEAILADAAAARDIPQLPVTDAVALLARAKAEKVALRHTSSRHQSSAESSVERQIATTRSEETVPPEETVHVVVGSDSLFEIDGAAVGKPQTAERAREKCRRMRGRSGTLHTGHHLIRLDTGAITSGVSSTVVHFGDFSDAEIEAYVATGEPLSVAGSFTLDGLGGAFITGVEGDPHGVVGLSLPLLRTLMAELDVAWIDLWTQR